MPLDTPFGSLPFPGDSGSTPTGGFNPLMPGDPNQPPPPVPGHTWVIDPTSGQWTLVSIPQWATEGPGGDSSGSAAAMKAAGLQYDLGLKGLEVDWAQVGIDKDRVGIEREQTAIQRSGQLETVRANKANEAAIKRQRALDSATSAISAYLRGTELSDARRLAAFQESRALLPSLVNPTQKYFAGQEPGGALATTAANYGFGFTPTEIQHKTLSPSSLATAPTGQQIGSDIMSRIRDVNMGAL